VREILSDLVAEQQYQDQFLQKTNIRDWKLKTPTPGWTIQDTVSHLASFEEYAYNALEEGGSRLAEASQYGTHAEFTLAALIPGRAMRPQDVIEWWREARAKVVVHLADGQRVEGVVEYFDRDMVKITRPEGPHFFVRKTDIRYVEEPTG